jgi:hypothetical protein
VVGAHENVIYYPNGNLPAIFFAKPDFFENLEGEKTLTDGMLL